MPFTLPVDREAPDSTQTVSIEGVAYTLRFRWNNRSGSWFFYLSPQGEDPLFKTRLVVGQDILEPYRGIPGVPLGGIFIVDTEKDYGRPGRNDLGISKRFQVVYIEESIMENYRSS